ncbi:uncharacterized protein LOC129730846 [Wyeomyia smithii]|uniref:uncharacterized protein LOC129730846 n=1 Tax=Wyeomyia smithii TaxID=174621 RepID=UPI002467B58D|nr:uncharacterized protein LOC129730846 [Wyeomyia smithii]
MATRRPRVKVAANLSIRRPSKALPVDSDKNVKTITTVKSEPVVDVQNVRTTNAIKEAECTQDERHYDGTTPTSVTPSIPTGVEDHTFKFPKPIEEFSRTTNAAPVIHSSLDTSAEEQHSPKKFDSKFVYINALNSPRKRIRTESMTSNKSYSDVSLKSRKAIKQEESQKASEAKRDLRKRLNNIQNVDKQSLTMFDMIYYNPAKNPMKNAAVSKKGSLENLPQSVDRERSISKSRSPTPAPAMVPPAPPEPSKPAIHLTPQLKLGPNGEMILDETSLVVENEREKEIRDTMAKTEIVYDDEFSGNSGYYSRYKRTRDWSPEETIRFYRCLHTIGTDFSMMIQLFPNRSRRDLKLKFKKEERLNLMLVNKALLYPKEFNIEELKQQFKQEDEEIERIREQEKLKKAEAEEKLQQQKTAKILQLNQNKSRNPKKRVSKAARVMLDEAEQLDKVEMIIKEPKPKRRKQKTTNNNSSLGNYNHPIQQETEITSTANNKTNDMPRIGDTFNVQPLENIAKWDMNDEQQDPKYVPNGQFTVQNNEYRETMSQPSNTPPLDIESMDIEIVDEESKSLYEIKAEPKGYSARLGDTNGFDSSNVITLQNLDDLSQTTVAYREPSVNREPLESETGTVIGSIESKYFDECDAIYMPMPANAPVAHPVVSDSYNGNYSFITAQTNSLQYDLHSTLLPFSECYDNRNVVEEPSQKKQNATSDQKIEEPEPEVVLQTESISQHIDSSEAVYKDLPNPSQELSDVAPGSAVERHELLSEPDQAREEEPHGLGPLENIDLNSLVLVESQDRTRPDKTIYEIYVIDPQTGKLSETPLDVPEDVIENIRSILESGED